MIVPVYNDARRLQSCLQALERQTYPEHRYEVIVVDNGSREPLEPVVAAFRRARMVPEPRPGSYAARNTGIGVAKGDVIAFTDADCIPFPAWIENGVSRLIGTSNCGLVGGKIEVFPEDRTRPTAIELFAMIVTYLQKEHIECDHYAMTANLFTSRVILDDVGPFDATLRSVGDLVWSRQVWGAGYRLIYAEDACVAHPAPRSLRQLYNRYARIAGGRRDIRRQRKYAGLAVTDTSAASVRALASLGARIWRDDRPRSAAEKPPTGWQC